MILEGANIFFDATDYTIYTMNSTTTGQYCVVLPKNNNGSYNMLVDLHMKNAFDGVSSGSKTKDQLVEEIKNEYMGVKTKYNDGILVIPMIDEALYTSAIVNNDKQKMFDKVKKIGAITSEIYKKLTDSGIDKQKIDQKIIVIVKNNDDIKFVDWLKEQMPSFVIGINASELQPASISNPFMENSNPFMAENPAPAVSNDIFGTASTDNTTTNNINNVLNTSVTNQEVPVNDIFNTQTSSTPEQVQPVTTPLTQEQPQIVEQSVPVQPAVEHVNPIQPTVTGPAPEITTNSATQSVAPKESVDPAPTAVQATSLEATTTITPVEQQETTETGGQTESTPEKKGSKGFTNLLILLVVLVGVTFISIELGKFLYNTYGV